MNATDARLRYLPEVAISTSSGKLLSDPESAEVQGPSTLLTDRLRTAPPGSVVPVSLGSVALTGSCIAALLTPALLSIARGDVSGRFVVVFDPGGQNAWDADAALRKQSERLGGKLVCVWRTDGGPELVGPVDEQVRKAYEFALAAFKASGGATSRQLAAAEGITIQSASNRLAKAAAQGLVYAAHLENVAGGGRQQVFVPVE
jgi:hypothetical protein